MGKKIEKGLNKDKNPSATSQDDVDSNKALEPHVCTGNFSADFSELCRRNNMTYIPPVVMRPRPPAPAAQQDVSPSKGGKDKGKPSVSQPDPEPEETAEDGEPEPKTFTTKDKFEYFKPCVQVEMDNPDKPDTVTEVFIRGWKIDNVMMEIFTQCWQTMEKLHSLNLWNTGLSSEGITSLAGILPSCANLKNLTLDGNNADEENWYELITEESPIQNISLRHCGITNKGAIMIGRCLGSSKRTNVKLLTLNLSNNKIEDEGLMEIAQGLRLNRSLLSLSLASNQIGDKGVVKLSEVLSRFPLTHDEVVERRRQMSDRGSPDRNKSPSVASVFVKQKDTKRKSLSLTPPLSRRADSVNRPGSVRSNTHPDKGGKKAEKPSAKAKKDGKKDEKDDKHDKTKGKKDKEEKPAAKKDSKGKEHLKVPSHGNVPSSPGHHDHHGRGQNSTGSNVGGRSSGASLAADAKKGGKGGKGGKGNAKPQTAEHEASDGPEFINPLLEGADFIDGQLWVTGNRVLINVNLSRNQIGETGMAALLKAIQYQTTIGLDSKSSGTGLMRLLVGKNKLRPSHETMQKITDLMVPKDPFYKPPPQTPDVEA